MVTEATREIMRYAFVQAGFHRLEARCNASNPGSFRVMEKLGMSFEGVLREQLKIKGQFVDQRLYSILRQDTEWSV
ncbi:GNAT family N-acetyltransferase [Paenibacillus sp. AR247]|uniref:GNAT family N-acetyltransferase n=1 Tax=Paenibacillus sp. AR247 TaxID=1631599 RepID=UPI0035BE2843